MRLVKKVIRLLFFRSAILIENMQLMFVPHILHSAELFWMIRCVCDKKENRIKTSDKLQDNAAEVFNKLIKTYGY